MKIIPFELKRSLKSGIIFLIILFLLAILPFYYRGYMIVLLTSIFMYIVITISWTIFSGPTGYISLASAAFFGVGIYISAIIGKKLPIFFVFGLGGLTSFCLAFIVGTLTLRLKGIYFVMFTFGLVELFLHFTLWWEVNITGTTGRVVLSLDNKMVYFLMLIMFVLCILVAYYIKTSKFGLALKSIGEDEEASAHIGINVTKLKVIVFALSASFIGVTGSIMATRWTYIDPKIAFNPLISFLPVLMAIFGGMGEIYGSLIGAIIFTYLDEFLITRFPNYYMLIFGIIMAVTVLYLPDGLVGLIKRLKRKNLEHFDANP